jgi:hypothetical protein
MSRDSFILLILIDSRFCYPLIPLFRGSSLIQPVLSWRSLFALTQSRSTLFQRSFFSKEESFKKLEKCSLSETPNLPSLS